MDESVNSNDHRVYQHILENKNRIEGREVSRQMLADEFMKAHGETLSVHVITRVSRNMNIAWPIGPRPGNSTASRVGSMTKFCEQLDRRLSLIERELGIDVSRTDTE